MATTDNGSSLPLPPAESVVHVAPHLWLEIRPSQPSEMAPGLSALAADFRSVRLTADKTLPGLLNTWVAYHKAIRICDITLDLAAMSASLLGHKALLAIGRF